MQQTIAARSLLRTAALAFVITAAVTAESRAETGASSARISYADLNLNDAEDVAALEERVRRLSVRLCRDHASPVTSRETVSRCVEATMARAMLQVDVAVSRAQRHGESVGGAAPAKESV